MAFKKPFITAKWMNLILATYRVPPEILIPYLPAGLEPEVADGSAFVSLVAFNFLDTSVMGLKVPFHVNFPEINLRFYVRNNQTKGVVFIREFVPKYFVCLIANKVYYENYRKIQMSSELRLSDEISVSYKLNVKGNRYSIFLKAENKPFIPLEDSTAHFFKEHKWGYTKAKNGETLLYEVVHPTWEIYPVLDFKYEIDFGRLYGKEWSFLNSAEPYYVMFAKGSEVEVYKAEPLIS